MEYLHYYKTDLINYLKLDNRKYPFNYTLKLVLYKTKKQIDGLYELDDTLINILKSRYVKCNYKMIEKLVKTMIVIKESNINDLFNETIEMIII